MKIPYIAHGAVAMLGLLAVVTSARATQSYRGLSLFPPDPRTLVPASATAYVPLDGSATAARARRDVATAIGLDSGRVGVALAVLAALGDRAGVVEWPAGGQRTVRVGDRCPASISSGNPHGAPLALIAQLKVSDVVALTQDPAVKSHVDQLRRGLGVTPSYTCAGVAVYRVTLQDEGGGYAAIVAGDGVFATDPATIDRIILANASP